VTRMRLVAAAAMVLGIAALAWILHRPARSPDAPAEPASAMGAPDRAAPGSRLSDTSDGDRSRHDGAPKPTVGGSATALIGSVVAPVQATISVRQPARIQDVFAREGETVAAGAILVTLEQVEADVQVRSARAAQAAAAALVGKARAGLRAQRARAGADVASARGELGQAENRLKQATLARLAAADAQKADLQAANEGVRKAEIALGRARETARELEELARVGGVSRSDLDGARSQQRAAQSDFDSAKAQVERLQQGPGGVPYRIATADQDVASAESAVRLAAEGVKTAETAGRQAIHVAEQDVRSALAGFNQAGAGVAGAHSARAQDRLASPIAGVVTNLQARRGEIAQPGAPLATVVSLAGLRVDALVPARLLALFHGGQPASVSVDTAPGRAFSAIVSEIARIAEPDGRTFRVKFRLLGSPPLLPGQTARIRVKTGG